MADTPTPKPKRTFVQWLKRISYKALRTGFVAALATLSTDLTAALTDHNPIVGEPTNHLIVVGFVALVGVVESELSRPKQ